MLLVETWQVQARSLVFSADGRYLAVVYGKLIVLYALDPNAGARRVSVIDMRVLRCAFRPDGATLACLQGGRTPRTALVAVPDGRVLDGFEGDAIALAWSPNGELLARSREGGIEVCDVRRRQDARIVSVDRRSPM